jgi:hypothetical protein
MNDIPSDTETLILDAVIVRDGQAAPPDTLGVEMVSLPAVLFPEGSAPPGGDWIPFGVIARPARSRQVDDPTPSGGSEAPNPPADAAPTAARPAETRFRHENQVPPTPREASEPVTSAAQRWLRMRRRKADLPPPR